MTVRPAVKYSHRFGSSIAPMTAYRVFCIKEIHSLDAGEVLGSVYRVVYLPFVPYPGLRIFLDLHTTIRSKDVLWNARTEQFQFLAPPSVFDPNVTKQSPTTLEMHIGLLEAEGWKLMTKEVIGELLQSAKGNSAKENS